MGSVSKTASDDAKIGDIQILRAVAILLVLAQHLTAPALLFKYLFPSLRMPFWSGVLLFFVISGYVVTSSLLGRPTTAVSFLIRRAFRLWPAMLCFLAFSGAVSIAAWLLPVSEWGKINLAADGDRFFREAAHILAGTLPSLGMSMFMNGAMWSLSVEFQFYAAYGALLFTLFVMRLPLRAVVLWVAVPLYLACLTIRLGGSSALAMAPEPLRYMVILSFDYLFLGVIGAAGIRPLMPEQGVRFGALSALLMLLVALVVLTIVPADFAPVHVLTTVAQLLAMPVAGLCFLGLVMLASVNAAVPARGSTPYRFLLWIGELSYSIYLFHLPVFGLFWLALATLYPVWFHVGDPGIAQTVVCVPATFAIAWLVYQYVEFPMNRIGAALAKRRFLSVGTT